MPRVRTLLVLVVVVLVSGTLVLLQLTGTREEASDEPEVESSLRGADFDARANHGGQGLQRSRTSAGTPGELGDAPIELEEPVSHATLRVVDPNGHAVVGAQVGAARQEQGMYGGWLSDFEWPETTEEREGVNFALTDEYGKVVFDNLPVDERLLLGIRATGFVEVSGAVHSIGMQGTLDLGEVRLSTGRKIRVRVRTPQGDSLAGVPIELEHPRRGVGTWTRPVEFQPGWSYQGTQLRKSGKDGLAHFLVPSGDSSLVSSRGRGFLDNGPSFLVPPSLDEVELVVDPGVAVRGTVKSADGKPVSGAHVLAWSRWGASTTSTPNPFSSSHTSSSMFQSRFVTDGSGRFQAQGLAENEPFFLTAWVDHNFYVATSWLHDASGEIEIKLPVRFEVRGRIDLPGAAAHSGAHVLIRPAPLGERDDEPDIRYSLDGQYRYPLDSSGGFLVSLQPGPYRMHVVFNGGRQEDVKQFALDSFTDLGTIRLEPGITVALRILDDHTGRPIPGATGQRYRGPRKNRKRESWRRTEVVATADAQGFMRWPAEPARRVRYYVQASGYLPGMVECDLTENDEPDIGEVRLERPGFARLRAFDANGEPALGVPIELVPKAGSERHAAHAFRERILSSYERAWVRPVAPDGIAYFQDLPPGTYSVLGVDPEYDDKPSFERKPGPLLDEIEIRSAEVTELSVSLASLGQLRIRVLAGGLLVEGAEVGLWVHDDSALRSLDSMRPSQTTGRNGECRIQELLPGSYWIGVRRAGAGPIPTQGPWSLQKITLRAGNQSLDLEIPAASIRATLSSPSGASGLASVWLARAGTDRFRFSNGTHVDPVIYNWIRSNLVWEGFAMDEVHIPDLAPGEYRLWIQVGDELLQWTPKIELGEEELQLGEIRLRRTGTLSASIRGLEAWESFLPAIHVREVGSNEYLRQELARDRNERRDSTEGHLSDPKRIEVTLPAGVFQLEFVSRTGKVLVSTAVEVHAGQEARTNWQLPAPE